MGVRITDKLAYPLRVENIGHLFFLIYGIAACWLAIDRIGSMDSCFYLFKMLAFEKLNVEHQRYPAVITQLIPFLMNRAGFSLKNIMIGYSVSFVVVYYLCWLFVRYVAKNKNAALALVFISIIGVKYTFYWPVTEQFQAMVYCLVFYAWINAAKHRHIALYLGVAFIWLALAVVIHPLSVLMIGFVLVYEWLDERRYKDPKFYGVTALTLLVHQVYTKFIKAPNEYEEGKMKAFEDWQEKLDGFFELEGAKQFLDMFEHHHIGLVYLLIGVLAYFLFRLKLGKFLLISSISALTFFLITLSVPWGNSAVVKENLMLPFSLFIGIPLAKELIPQFKRIYLAWPLTVLLIYIGFSKVDRIRHLYEYRTEWHANMHEFMSQFPESKAVICRDNFPNEQFMVTWAAGLEALMRSSAEEKEPVNFGVTYEMRLTMDHPDPESVILGPDFLQYIGSAVLPERHMPLKATRFLELCRSDSLTSSGLRELLVPENFAGETKDFQVKFGRGIKSQRMIRFRMQNKSDETLRCNLGHPYPTRVGYEYLRADGSGSYFETSPTFPLELDLPPGTSYTQMLPLYRPHESGTYRFRIGLVNPILGGLLVLDEKDVVVR